MYQGFICIKDFNFPSFFILFYFKTLFIFILKMICFIDLILFYPNYENLNYYTSKITVW